MYKRALVSGFRGSYHRFETSRLTGSIALSCITGRAALEGAWEKEPYDGKFKRASSVIDLVPQSEEEVEAIQNAVVNHDGLLLSVLDVLRRVPRRVLMVLKLNDLTRLIFVAHIVPSF